MADITKKQLGLLLEAQKLMNDKPCNSTQVSINGNIYMIGKQTIEYDGPADSSLNPLKGAAHSWAEIDGVRI